ncbi:Eco57I restriction-modification methylase domain-containing protein [Rhodoferax antarcticus]|uniref:Eco57I restriction-modification methylase domain-containing protein n=1 Tax=Rhodoferax antarcticus TaxID=81479 RepID=UPI002223F870|nr:Eco57I restriction-modification methylase domain-containing protein [Rhodoferax antarcticus]MCW2310696.1 hypothetical protein [Rhodoferax antarcticus]
MPFDLQRARPLLQNCNLPTLFVEELGWEPARQKLTLREAERDYVFTAVAEKHGFTAYLCESADGRLPDHATRLKLDRKLSETSFEHLIVFVIKDRAQQSWLWVRRETGRPLAARSHDYHRGQPGDSLLQKLQALFVSLEETEAGLSTVVVAGRARAAFDIERVTKAFYRDFDIHRKAFLAFIDGIGEVADQEWYASVMLNRLMFVYFIQRKGFLDGDTNYLRNRLALCKKENGKDKFYSFYRFFLLKLFHEGFGKRRVERAASLEKLLGNIPYLNGGLFDVHELEKPERYGKTIEIPDKAFERIFDYFDQYQWHLDERALKADNEINPDVLGYIFEKYINQKQMGAYYTKEDITEYISKSCIIPFLFDAGRAKCKVAFDNTDGPTVWDLLKDNPDRYIFEAVKKGVHLPLPKDIALGVNTTKPDLLERRSGWNKAALAEYALPTETWREVIARRERYEAIHNKMVAGEVREINDFITLNLDLRQFAQDVIQSCEGPDLLMAFWQATTSITILDPTGGSGAFIFAALNILEPLYEGCLDRMEGFLTEWDEAGKKHHPKYHKKFTEVLQRVDAHPNRRYFVLKSIILNNLYAVDIMEEAVEICKLRLFLKLASQVDPDHSKDNLGIEPLPDIDFNIRAGNTLVGYATYVELLKSAEGDWVREAAIEEIKVKAGDLQQTFDAFRLRQTEGDGSVPAADKREIQKRLKALEDELNLYLASEYGIKVSKKAEYAQWLKSHQPFHWFIEFYGILARGGFDVIIGNPPYVEYSKVKREYTAVGFETANCGNIYAFVMERSAMLLNASGRFGMIVPLSICSSDRMATLRTWLAHALPSHHISNFEIFPSKLFDGAFQRLSIVLGAKQKGHGYVSRLHRWYAIERETLIDSISYTGMLSGSQTGLIFKIQNQTHRNVLQKLLNFSGSIGQSCQVTPTKHFVFYQEATNYWAKAATRIPFYKKNGVTETPAHSRTFYLASKKQAKAAMSFVNSSLFYMWYISLSDGFHMNDSIVKSFPANNLIFEDDRIEQVAIFLEKNIVANSFRTTRNTQSDRIEIEAFKMASSKSILDQIDTVLAQHYGFTPEELDFIINYDIKYRLGRGAGEEEE